MQKSKAKENPNSPSSSVHSEPGGLKVKPQIILQSRPVLLDGANHPVNTTENKSRILLNTEMYEFDSTTDSTAMTSNILNKQFPGFFKTEPFTGPQNGVVFLYGPSGVGKSTALIGSKKLNLQGLIDKVFPDAAGETTATVLEVELGSLRDLVTNQMIYERGIQIMSRLKVTTKDHIIRAVRKRRLLPTTVNTRSLRSVVLIRIIHPDKIHSMTFVDLPGTEKPRVQKRDHRAVHSPKLNLEEEGEVQSLVQSFSRGLIANVRAYLKGMAIEVEALLPKSRNEWAVIILLKSPFNEDNVAKSRDFLRDLQLHQLTDAPVNQQLPPIAPPPLDPRDLEIARLQQMIRERDQEILRLKANKRRDEDSKDGKATELMTERQQTDMEVTELGETDSDRDSEEEKTLLETMTEPQQTDADPTIDLPAITVTPEDETITIEQLFDEDKTADTTQDDDERADQEVQSLFLDAQKPQAASTPDIPPVRLTRRKKLALSIEPVFVEGLSMEKSPRCKSASPTIIKQMTVKFPLRNIDGDNKEKVQKAVEDLGEQWSLNLLENYIELNHMSKQRVVRCPLVSPEGKDLTLQTPWELAMNVDGAKGRCLMCVPDREDFTRTKFDVKLHIWVMFGGVVRCGLIGVDGEPCTAVFRNKKTLQSHFEQDSVHRA